MLSNEKINGVNKEVLEIILDIIYAGTAGRRCFTADGTASDAKPEETPTLAFLPSFITDPFQNFHKATKPAENLKRKENLKNLQWRIVLKKQKQKIMCFSAFVAYIARVKIQTYT